MTVVLFTVTSVIASAEGAWQSGGVGGAMKKVR
jgi:hypothetical protein